MKRVFQQAVKAVPFPAVRGRHNAENPRLSPQRAKNARVGDPDRVSRAYPTRKQRARGPPSLGMTDSIDETSFSACCEAVPFPAMCYPNIGDALVPSLQDSYLFCRLPSTEVLGYVSIVATRLPRARTGLFQR